MVKIDSSRIKAAARSIGFDRVGIARVDENYLDRAKEHLQAWLALGYHADMEWMNNPKRLDIKKIMPEVRSLICVALNYYTSHQHSENPEHGKIS